MRWLTDSVCHQNQLHFLSALVPQPLSTLLQKRFGFKCETFKQLKEENNPSIPQQKCRKTKCDMSLCQDTNQPQKERNAGAPCMEEPRKYSAEPEKPQVIHGLICVRRQGQAGSQGQEETRGHRGQAPNAQWGQRFYRDGEKNKERLELSRQGVVVHCVFTQHH